MARIVVDTDPAAGSTARTTALHHIGNWFDYRPGKCVDMRDSFSLLSSAFSLRG